MTIKLWDFQGFECLKTMYGKSFSYKHRRFVDDRATLLLRDVEKLYAQHRFIKRFHLAI